MEITKTDYLKVIAYLEDAHRLYASLPRQEVTVEGHRIPLLKHLNILPKWRESKYLCRAHMIRQLISKLKNKLTH